MKIIIEDYYDGFAVIVDGERFSIDQEDSRELLFDAFKKACPEAEVLYDEVY